MVKAFPRTKIKNRATNILKPFSLYTKSPTYRKLPDQLLKLSVLKLDGSSFGIHVARNATVSALKLAVEEEFDVSCSRDEMENKWSLVWSHFCLCYDGQKLTDEKACIRKYGIEDGDQLRFIQHLRIEQAPSPQLSFLRRTKARDARVNTRSTTIEDQGTGLEHINDRDDLDLLVPKPKFRTHSFKDLLPCSRFKEKES